MPGVWRSHDDLSDFTHLSTPSKQSLMRLNIVLIILWWAWLSTVGKSHLPVSNIFWWWDELKKLLSRNDFIYLLKGWFPNLRGLPTKPECTINAHPPAVPGLLGGLLNALAPPLPLLLLASSSHSIPKLSFSSHIWQCSNKDNIFPCTSDVYIQPTSLHPINPSAFSP